MLSRFLLLFDHKEFRLLYNHEKQDFYKKALPIIAGLLFALSLALEVLYRLQKYGDMPIHTSIINWATSVIFLGFSLLIWRTVYISWLVCPLLTLFAYYYFAFVDYQTNPGVIFFT